MGAPENLRKAMESELSLRFCPTFASPNHTTTNLSMRNILLLWVLLSLFSCREEGDIAPTTSLANCGQGLETSCDPSTPLSAPAGYRLDTIGHVLKNSNANSPFVNKFQFVNAQYGYAFATVGLEKPEFFRTTDGGASWGLVATPTAVLDINNLQFRDDNFGVLVVNSSQLLLTDDGGQNWRLQEMEGLQGQLNTLAFDAAGKLYLIDYDFREGESTLLKSGDDGATWDRLFVAKTGRAPSLQVSSEALTLYNREKVIRVSATGDLLSEVTLNVRADDFQLISEREWVYLAIEGGVFVTRDAGQSWTKIAESRGSDNIADFSGGRIIGFESATKGLFVNPVGYCTEEERAVEECVIASVDYTARDCQISGTAYGTNTAMRHRQNMGPGRWYLAVGEYLMVLKEE